MTNSYPVINTVVNALAYQDKDMNIMYTRGPNTTVMFYLSTKITFRNDSYISIHRTFPGVQKNSTTYNPPSRQWFKRAPQDSYYLYGPYVEGFTQQPVITLSSMKSTTDSATGLPLTFVSGAVMLISEVAAIGDSPFYFHPLLLCLLLPFYS